MRGPAKGRNVPGREAARVGESTPAGRRWRRSPSCALLRRRHHVVDRRLHRVIRKARIAALRRHGAFAFSALLCKASLPCLMRGAHAALSPSFGAPAAPVPWQAMHTVSYVDLPLPPAAVAPAAGAAGGGIVTAATCVPGAVAGAAAAGAGGAALGSTTTWAAGARRLATAAS